MSAKLPIIEQLHNCNSDRERADILLRCPDSIILKYAPVFDAACQSASFEAGRLFVAARVAILCATRNAAGGLPGGPALELETMRAEFAAYVAGAPIRHQKEAAPPP